MILFKRRLLFALAGMLALTAWAGAFAALSSLGAYGAACYFSPNRHNALGLIIVQSVTTMIPISLPLTFILSLVVALRAPGAKRQLRPLLWLGASRSLVGAVSLAILGALIAAVMGVGAAREAGQIAPPFFYGLIAGWICGFFVGLIGGSGECLIRSRENAARPRSQVETPPIAAP